MTEFQERVSLNDYHIVAVVESWTTDDLRDSELYLDGYDMYREDKKPGKGGGILLYVKDTLKSVRFNKLASVGFEQSIWCIVELKSSRYLIGTCYRSPSNSAENGERLLELLYTAVIQSRVSNVIVIGDFNYPDMDYERFYAVSYTHLTLPTNREV